MVQKSKGGKKCRSVVAGKKSKVEMKHNRKTNYKKKVAKKVECCVCMEEIPDTSDNTITCGKVNHHLCGECKMKCDTCPMCRSHKIKNPISQNVNLRVVQKNQTGEIKREKILVKGMKINQYDIGEGIYEKISNRWQLDVYKHEILDLYIYQDYYDVWTLNNIFDRDCEYCIAESESESDTELIGNHKWNMGICGYKKGALKTVVIKKLK